MGPAGCGDARRGGADRAGRRRRHRSGRAWTSRCTSGSRAKLAAQPVEDLRLDFEDGYGARPDAEEDADAVAAAGVLRDDCSAAPGRAELRRDPVQEPGAADPPPRAAHPRPRAGRAAGRGRAAGGLPRHPARRSPPWTRFGRWCGSAPSSSGRTACRPGALRFEIQVETTQAILGADGAATVAQMIHAAENRCTALHYGTFDYSAACGVSAAQQSLAHPVADHAKAVMQVAAAGTGVRVCDGSTNVMPVGDTRRRSPRRSGCTRSWSAAPWSGPTTRAGTCTPATWSAGTWPRTPSTGRAFPPRPSGSRTIWRRQGGGVVDEPATAQALAAFVVRGVHCGAVDDAEVPRRPGVDRATLDALAQRRVPTSVPPPANEETS